jgi:para-nitrobenzyl esterase
MQGATGKSTLYRYEFDDAPPAPANAAAADAAPRGAYHSAEIEFVFGALASKNLPWRPEDKALSDLISTYWSNFAKNGDPNSTGLPQWPVYNSQGSYPVMHLDATSHAAPDDHRGRYEFLDKQQ